MNTTDSFIRKAKVVHGDKYDYSETIYEHSHLSVHIVCKIHGSFFQTASSHLSGKGCKSCGSIRSKTLNGGTLTEFIRKSRARYGDKFSYAKSEYIDGGTALVLVCDVHGSIEATPTAHLQNRTGYHNTGCKQCNLDRMRNIRRKSTFDFIEKANSVHGDTYDYSEVNYINAKTKVKILCKEHGEFEQIPRAHIGGSGCVLCGHRKSGNASKSNTDQFIIDAKIIHSDKYDYSKTKYSGASKYLIIVCPKHGEFNQMARAHLQGSGCQLCSRENSANFHRTTLLDFITESNRKHNNKYRYSKSIYVNTQTNIVINCPVHGDFEQLPSNHLRGHGCFKCSNDFIISQPEKEILGFIKSTYKQTVSDNDRKTIFPLELDIILPEIGIAIEFNGLYWHSEKHKPNSYHFNKWDKCYKKGIRLIQIWEDEWRDKRELCESFLKSLMIQSEKLYARKLSIKPVTVDEQKSFLSNYHFQGYVGATKCLGLYLGDDLVQLMSLKKLDSQGNYEIGRLCTKSGYSVVGGSERLFKNLLQNLNYTSIISFNNLDKFTGEVYSRLGMKLEKARVESYHYTNGIQTYSRNQFQKHRLVAKGHDPNLSEHQIANSLGFYKVFSTGNSKYILIK